MEAFVLAQLDDGSSQTLGVILVTICFQPVHQELVYIGPDRTPPVFEGVDYALCPILLPDTGVQRAS